MAQVIGLDTSIFIYLFEKNPKYIKSVRHILGNVKDGKIHGIFSCIGLIEILTGPKKLERFDIAALYQEQITNFPNLTVRGINENMIEIASDLRARYNITTPDAIHIATAIDSGSKKFLTNDKTLKKIQEINIELI